MGSNPVPVVQETVASLGSTAGGFRAEQPSAAIAATVTRTGHIRRARSRHPVNSEVVGLTALGQSITFLPASRPSAGNVSRRHVAAAGRTIYNVRRSETEQVASNMRADADPEQGRRTGEGRHHQFSWDPRAAPTARHRTPARCNAAATSFRPRGLRPPAVGLLRKFPPGIKQWRNPTRLPRRWVCQKIAGCNGGNAPYFLQFPPAAPGALSPDRRRLQAARRRAARRRHCGRPVDASRGWYGVKPIVEVTGQNALSSVSANR